MTAPAVSIDLLAEALFASNLQPSDRPGSQLVWDTVHATVIQLGEKGCEARVAQEYGDHPEDAARRMCWCVGVVKEAFACV